MKNLYKSTFFLVLYKSNGYEILIFAKKWFCMKYIKFSKDIQSRFLKSVKLKTGLTWIALAKSLNLSKSMVYYLVNGHSLISKNHYLRLCNLAKIKPESELSLIDIKNKEEQINLPLLSPKFGEFLGALSGDGHINTTSYEVSITLDKHLDEKYSQKILSLFKDLFGINARKYLHKTKNAMKCYIYSKKLVNFLISEYNLPEGKKKNRLHIPLSVQSDNGILASFIKGLFDTDGTFHRHHKKDAMLGISSRDVGFLNEVKTALMKLGFTPSLHSKNLYLYRKEEIDNFFTLIQPNNDKHLLKYFIYKKEGRVPLTKEIRELNL
jgi:hypothetical protein